MGVVSSRTLLGAFTTGGMLQFRVIQKQDIRWDFMNTAMGTTKWLSDTG